MIEPRVLPQLPPLRCRSHCGQLPRPLYTVTQIQKERDAYKAGMGGLAEQRKPAMTASQKKNAAKKKKRAEQAARQSAEQAPNGGGDGPAVPIAAPEPETEAAVGSGGDGGDNTAKKIRALNKKLKQVRTFPMQPRVLVLKLCAVCEDRGARGEGGGRCNTSNRAARETG